MADDERNAGKGGCGEPVEGGYSIFLGAGRIEEYMTSGDFSTARELAHFERIGSQIERRTREGEGHALLALSVGEERISRDFAVLQIAHVIAKHGKRVLIVDCDFLRPGLGGLVENVDDHGFLDFLLYGSSLKKVAKGIGIDGVRVMGPGSFPVSRTVPFALKEFEKIGGFLKTQSDIVIYCSTLYGDDGNVNPLATQVDGIVLFCRLEDTGEGQLQRHLADLGPGIAPVDLVCFCDEKEREAVPAGPAESVPRKQAPSRDERRESRGEPEALEKTDEIEIKETRRGGGVNLPRFITIGVAVVIVAFVSWWLIMSRSISEREPDQQLAERVAKEREARIEQEGGVPTGAADTSATTAGEVERPADTVATAEVAPAEPPPPEETQPAQEAPAPTRRGLYTVHVASFKELSRVEAEIEYLESKGYDARYRQVTIKGEQWIRVYVGEFATREEAAQARIELLALPRIGYARVIEVKPEQP